MSSSPKLKSVNFVINTDSLVWFRKLLNFNALIKYSKVSKTMLGGAAQMDNISFSYYQVLSADKK